MSAPKQRLSEGSARQCLARIDWPGLQAHLASVRLDEEEASKLVGLVMRSKALVFRYPGNVRRRDALIEGIIAKIRGDVGDEAADAAEARLAVLSLIDEGYAGLRSMIDDLPLGSFSQQEQVAAYLAYFARDWHRLRCEVDAAGASGAPVIGGSVILEAPEGGRYGADAMTALLVALLGMNVILASYKGKWLDPDGIVRLPTLPTATDENIARAGAANGTALAWQQWQLIEERCRYMDGDLVRRRATDVDDLPPGSIILEHEPNGIEWEVLDTVANERLGERLTQTFHDMSVKTGLLSQGRGVDPGAALPPLEYVSPEELHSAVMLSEYLGLNIAADPSEFGGLRLCEWLRGFAVLQQLVNDNLKTAADPLERAFPKLAVSQMEHVLQRNGLVGEKARTFIDHASFARSSRDIYDAPILRGAGDWCLLAGPALSAALLIRLVLSTLANKELTVEDKGDAFEEQFRAVLTAQGLPVYHFEVRRGGETYEYDALVPWGPYLFVFECKNRGLSGTNPIASFNFLRSVVSHARQVQRLARALADYPDILTGQVKEDCSALRIVPVVVSSMPFSMQGAFEGVHFNDMAAINRFFSERYSHVGRLHRVGPHKILHRVAIHDIWERDAPDADAFAHHLNDPLQLRVMMAHMQIEQLGIQIGPGLYATTKSPRRREMTLASMAAVGGVTADAVEAEMERFSQALAPLRVIFGEDGASPETINGSFSNH